MAKVSNCVMEKPLDIQKLNALISELAQEERALPHESLASSAGCAVAGAGRVRGRERAELAPAYFWRGERGGGHAGRAGLVGLGPLVFSPPRPATESIS